MPEHVQYEDHDLFNPETHHESSDVPVRPLWWAVIIFVVFSIATHFVLYFMYKGMARAERNRMDPPQSAVPRPADASVPANQPLLQPFPKGNIPPHRNTPASDMADMRKAEEKALGTYGWVDKEHGVVHIPIDVAKDLAVERLKSTDRVIIAPVPVGTTPSPANQPAAPVTGSVPPATNTAPPATTTATATAPATGGAHQ